MDIFTVFFSDLRGGNIIQVFSDAEKAMKSYRDYLVVNEIDGKGIDKYELSDSQIESGIILIADYGVSGHIEIQKSQLDPT